MELSFSQAQPIFQKLDQSNGLSNGRVTSIKKSTNGFMWIGTKDGLNRYDGFEFKVYTKRNSKISSNHISDILIDSNGRMWVTTLGGGLNLYDPLVDDFKAYKNIPGDTKSIASNQVNVIFEDSKGLLWIGTENGLCMKMPGEEIFKSYTHLNEDKNSITHNSVRAIYEDISGNIWIGTFGGGLNKFDRVKETFSSVNSGGEFYTDFIHVISSLNDHEILIGTSGSGLLKIDITNYSFSNYFDNNLQQLSNVNIVKTIHQDHESNLWIGTDGHGILKIEKANTENPDVFNYLYDSRIKSSLSGNAVYEIYEDKEGDIWIGTAWNGINILNQDNIYDSFYSDIKGRDPSPVLAINKKDNKLYFGLDGKGLTVYNTELSKATYYNKDENTSIGANYLQFITLSKDGTFWIGTFANGLINFNPETEKYVQYKHDLNDVGSLRLILSPKKRT